MKIEQAIGLLTCAALVSCGHSADKRVLQASTSPQAVSPTPSHEMDGIFFKDYPYIHIYAMANLEDSLSDIENQCSISGKVCALIKVSKATKEAQITLFRMRPDGSQELLPGSFANIPSMKLKLGDKGNSTIHYKGNISKGLDHYLTLHIAGMKQTGSVNSLGLPERIITLVDSSYCQVNSSNMRERTIEFLGSAMIEAASK